MLRREFLASLALPALAADQPRLGVDLFSLRSQGWSAFESLDYCAKGGARTVHFSEIRFLGSLEDEHVRKVGARARELGIDLEIGMRSICPGSTAFDSKAGTAEEQLSKVLKAAKLSGSKLVRAFLGTSADRPGGIEARIEETAKVLRNSRSLAQDLGLKIAIENHAGDMQSRELKSLIELAGKDFVGACYDTGNPCWVLEDPLQALETLAPYVLTSHFRDSYVWLDDSGIQVNWTRMGEGNVGMENLLKRFVELCPGKAMSLEVIVMGPRTYAWRKPTFWKGYESVPAPTFARFLALASSGVPQPKPPQLTKEQALQREREDFEASLAWTKRALNV